MGRPGDVFSLNFVSSKNRRRTRRSVMSSRDDDEDEDADRVQLQVEYAVEFPEGISKEEMDAVHNAMSSSDEEDSWSPPSSTDSSIAKNYMLMCYFVSCEFLILFTHISCARLVTAYNTLLTSKYQ